MKQEKSALMKGYRRKRELRSLFTMVFGPSSTGLIANFSAVLALFLQITSNVYFKLQQPFILLIIIYKKKFLHFDWLRAVQFFFENSAEKR